MNKNIFVKTTAFLFTLLLSIPLLTSSLGVEASTSTDKRVTARVGLNLRNNNCEIVSVMRYNTRLNMILEPTGIPEAPASRQCTVKGVAYNMKLVSVLGDSLTGYVAENWLADWDAMSSASTPTTSTSNVLRNPNYDETRSARVNTYSGLWLRDIGGKLVRKVPYGTVLESINTCQGGIGGSALTANVRGKTYELVYVCYQGQPMSTASYLIKNI
ncbi:MAG: hypothetical protein AAGF07_03980 [Patescibacteria group bacterium]